LGYRLSRKAEEDIIGLIVEGIERFGQSQAEHYQVLLEQQLQSLAENPRMGRQRPELEPCVRVWPVMSHLIVYTVEDHDEVFVVRVCRKREDWESEDQSL
jgi:toxin ParE1/3/4